MDGELSFPLREFMFLAYVMYTPCIKLTKCHISMKQVKCYGCW